MGAQLEKDPERLRSQWRPLKDEIAKRLQPDPSPRAVRVGAQLLQHRENLDWNLGQVENEPRQVCARYTGQVRVDEERQTCPIQWWLERWKE